LYSVFSDWRSREPIQDEFARTSCTDPVKRRSSYNGPFFDPFPHDVIPKLRHREYGRWEYARL
jgi:hypothetical protein